jgi:N-acylglucosamine 2-epimerase
MNFDRKKIKDLYRKELFDNVIPFWLKYSLDEEFGGFISQLDREGTPYGKDKSVWVQGRATWLFSKLYNHIEKNPDWLYAARLGADFIKKFAFDESGRAFFRLNQDGKPINKPWSIFSETFLIIGLAHYAKASGDELSLEQAVKTYWNLVSLLDNPEKIGSNTVYENYPVKGHAIPMIMVATTQELREIVPDDRYQPVMKKYLGEILWVHARDDVQALLENVNSDGSMIPGPEGRCVNPGHAIESAWFCLREGQKLKDKNIIKRALEILDWSLRLGWDEEYGGLFYFVDLANRPLDQLEWDMKLWWPHTEALYALLLAYELTGDEKYAQWFIKIHEWSFAHFPDKEYGEWYGYLHRDGSISHTLKGNLWKGPFHLPRALLYSYLVL